MQSKLFNILSIFILFLIGCSKEELPEADLVVVAANIYYMNSESSRSITEELLKQNGDIYILIEAAIGTNVDSVHFAEQGYTLYDLGVKSISGSMVLATRIEGEYSEISYPTMVPSVALRIPYRDTALTIIGVHPPAPYHSTQEAQKKAFEEMRTLAANGRAARNDGVMQKGDLLILAGDFNSFPTDPNMKIVTNDMGLEDAAYAAENPYQYTWGPHISPTKFARIDYLFASPEVTIHYQELFGIEGSDHEGITTGINY